MSQRLAPDRSLEDLRERAQVHGYWQA